MNKELLDKLFSLRTGIGYISSFKDKEMDYEIELEKQAELKQELKDKQEKLDSYKEISMNPDDVLKDVIKAKDEELDNTTHTSDNSYYVAMLVWDVAGGLIASIISVIVIALCNAWDTLFHAFSIRSSWAIWAIFFLIFTALTAIIIFLITNRKTLSYKQIVRSHNEHGHIIYEELSSRAQSILDEEVYEELEIREQEKVKQDDEINKLKANIALLNDQIHEVKEVNYSKDIDSLNKALEKEYKTILDKKYWKELDIIILKLVNDEADDIETAINNITEDDDAYDASIKLNNRFEDKVNELTLSLPSPFPKENLAQLLTKYMELDSNELMEKINL